MRKKGNWHYTSLCFEWQCSNTWFIGEWCNCLLVKYGATFFVIWWRTHTCFYTRLCPGVRICQTAQTFNNVTFVDTHTCTYSRSTQINTMNHVLSNRTITVTRNYLETGLNVIRHFLKINHSFWLTGIPFDRNIFSNYNNRISSAKYSSRCCILRESNNWGISAHWYLRNVISTCMIRGHKYNDDNVMAQKFKYV